ncbi:MAG TPA: glycosyltransferase family 39 protein [Methanothermobacter sp.]|nr:glycosyltransferase family 39 protein [Methanothermobacter sp.]
MKSTKEQPAMKFPSAHDRKILILLVSIVSIITYKLITTQDSIGVYYWDIFLYLNNALRMAHLGTSDTLYLPPLLPSILSVFFRLGFVKEYVLFIVCGAFYILGSVGMYLLLRLRFDEIESLLGALTFASFTLILAWAVTGSTDVPAISLSIWAIYLTLLAKRKDKRFYYLAFPVAMAAFLTRYVSALIIIPILLVIIMDTRPKFREITGGIILGILFYSPFGLFFYRNLKEPLPFLGQFTATASGSVTAVNPGYNLDSLYYLKHLPEYLSSFPSDNYMLIINPSSAGPTPLAYLILAILAVGIIFYIIRNRMILNGLRTRRLIVFLLLSAALVAVFGRISYALAEVLIFLWALSIYWLLEDHKPDNLDINLAMVTWFLAFLYMHSFHPVKVDRYIITILPAIAYAMPLSISEISQTLKLGRVRRLIPILVMFLMLSSAAYYILGMPRDYPIVDAEHEAAQWLKAYDPNYHDKVIASDRGPAFTWYLKDYVFTRRINKNNTELSYRLFTSSNQTIIYTGQPPNQRYTVTG